SSPRKDRPFMALYCGNISENLLESELFGHKKGAFTGAVENKKGMLELADGGTFLLDEIADIPLNLQAKLLRFLQEGEIKAVGDNRTKKVNVRILAATNKILIDEVKKGNFREDLYYRLNVLKLDLPPLRERRDDIPLLALHFLKKHTDQDGAGNIGISKNILKSLRLHSWPGNVRELENVIARAVVMCTKDEIDEDCILFDEPAMNSADGRFDDNDMTLKAVMKQHVMRILSLTEGNRSEANRILGISRNYLYSLIDEIKEDGVEL
ncbi:MAG: sigma-54-dependent Fis family transcriptional regulator, partial [FCB group bacterium]|nr:sigma-54-dependent Fis family transcriptional regulator [FCB group bacterium]